MTREEAIEILRDTPIAINSSREDDIHTLYAMAQNMAIEALEKEPKWIPVTERLPKAGEYVGDVAKYYLVQNEYGDMLVARFTHSEYWEQMYQLKPHADKIVAWMPLPEPYKESEE